MRCSGMWYLVWGGEGNMVFVLKGDEFILKIMIVFLGGNCYFRSIDKFFRLNGVLL